VRAAARFRWLTILLAAVVLGASLLLAPNIGSEFLPPSGSRSSWASAGGARRVCRSSASPGRGEALRLDPDDLSRREAYQLMIGTIVPRPIAWIGSISKAGVVNQAPLSFFNGVTADPPMISVCIGHRRGEMKDTLANILETREFVVNVVEDAAGEAMVATSADLPPETDEFAACGVEPEPSEFVAASRVREITEIPRPR
jgi:hypothetical protein